MGRARRERGWPAPPDPLPAAVVDNHTHLEAVLGFVVDEPWTLTDHLARAAAVGVAHAVQIGCDLESARWTDGVVTEQPQLLGGVGIHPNEAVLHAGVREVAPDGLDPSPLPRHDVALDDAVAEVAALARANPRLVVVGETGLDYFRAGHRGRQIQREAFRAHIAIAKELGLVLQIHDRDAHRDVVDTLERDGAPPRTVFHCFSGDAEMARRCVANGWYLSFAGPVTYPSNAALRAALREVPLDLLLVETDAPYLAPQPVRGRPNAPYLLPHTVRAVATILDRPLEDLCTGLRRASAHLYGC